MSFGGPSKYCPRCNTLLPAQATVCSTCGLQFPASVPPGSNYGAPQYPPQSQPNYPPQAAPGFPPQSQPNYAPQGQPGFPPQSQPNYAPQGQPGYPPQSAPGYPPQAAPGFAPQGQPGYAGYPGAPVMAPPAPAKKGGAGKAIILVLVLVVLVGGGAAAWFLFLSPGHSNGVFFDRHGLQSNVPLPNNTSWSGLKKTFTSTDPDTKLTLSADAWGWTVSGSDPTAIQQFYKDNLPKNGWSRVNPFSGDNGEQDLSACQGGQVLLVGASAKDIQVTDDNNKVTDTVKAPSGGSALITELSTSPLVVQLFCSNSPIVPTP